MKKIIYLFLIFSLSALGTYSIGNLNIFQNDEISSELDYNEFYVPTYKHISGRELTMVYIGSPHCRFSDSPEMPELVEKSKLKAQRISKDIGANFAAIGVSIGWSVSEGLKRLDKFGTFDEVMSGRSWFNIGARKFIYNDVPSNIPGSVPQIVLVIRDILIENETDNKVYKITEQSEYARFRGLDEIADFANNFEP